MLQNLLNIYKTRAERPRCQDKENEIKRETGDINNNCKENQKRSTNRKIKIYNEAVESRTEHMEMWVNAGEDEAGQPSQQAYINNQGLKTVRWWTASLLGDAC